MAALVLGEIVRIRWRAVDATATVLLDRPDLNAREAATLLDGGETLWGFVPSQVVRLTGNDLRGASIPAELIAMRSKNSIWRTRGGMSQSRLSSAFQICQRRRDGNCRLLKVGWYR